MPSVKKKSLKKLKDDHFENLAREMYEHLEWCGWGDKWERECSENLRARCEEFFGRNT